MNEIKSCNSICIRDLLSCSSRFVIPLYQRNFSWEYKEIEQLIIDISDSIATRDNYYIGTLVVCENSNGTLDIIDGQQRFTAILLICLAIQNKFGYRDISTLNLSFAARKASTTMLEMLLEGKMSDEGNEILDGYRVAEHSLKEQLGDGDYKAFFDYLLDKVLIFVDNMPCGDVNLYFERFNSRGEQLEAHEIIKGELIERLLNQGCDSNRIAKFTKIWDACSEFELPCIKSFKKKTRGVNDDEECEKVFKCQLVASESGKKLWRYGYDLSNVYRDVEANNENRASILSALTAKEDDGQNANKSDDNNAGDTDEFARYRCIVNFNTFLYYVLYITDNQEKDVQFDDKKLKEAFDVGRRTKEWILEFGENLLKTKFIFDNFIIRSATETTSRLKKDEWYLHKAYREDRDSKKNHLLYVQIRFDKNSFESYNYDILMIQSMFATTFTAYKDTKWLFSTLKYLFDNADKLNNADFGGEFLAYLENLSREYACERICCDGKVDKNRLRYDKGVPVFAFNLTDYILWKNREALKSQYQDIRFDIFRFTYRRSIEHWYPQNPNGQDGHCKMDNSLLHSFGNLCNIVASQNSSFGNLPPLSKYGKWQHSFVTQSLKLQMMAKKTKEWDKWDETTGDGIGKMENDLLVMLQAYIYNDTVS